MPDTLPPPADSPLAALLPRDQAARYIGFSPATLADWAIEGKYRDELPFARIGKRAFYRRSDLDKFIQSRFPANT